MYRNNSQKPDDEFITRFQRTFADVVPRRDSDHGAHPGVFQTGPNDPMMAARYGDCKLVIFFFSSLEFKADMANLGLRSGDGNGMKMEEAHLKFSNERTPRNLQDLNYSPTWMDTGSMLMTASLAGQHPGFYTPNSGGMGAIFHSQAGDLHTPTVGLNMITPLSLSNPIQGIHHNLEHFNPQYIAQNLHDMNPYLQQASYAPSAFMHRVYYDAMDESGDSSSVYDIAIDAASNVTASTEFSVSGIAPMGISYIEGEK